MSDAPRRLVVEFTKMNGAGNDFIVIDNRFYAFSGEELAQIARLSCSRRTGIGADGVLAISDPRQPDHHYRMQYYNADGSMGTMCGNGARCLARYARNAGFVEDPLIFETAAGTYEAMVPSDPAAHVRLQLPPWRDHVEMPGDRHFVWTGTEHLVVFVDSAALAPVASEGPKLRNDRTCSSNGVNVDFVEVVGSDSLLVRTWEKGVEGETLACGTGAAAAAVIARLTGRVDADVVTVSMPGGVLRIGTDPDNPFLEGPATTVYRGTFEQ